MNDDSEARESRSVRLSRQEWEQAEALGRLFRRASAGEGLRRALDSMVQQIIREGSIIENDGMCPAGGHPFVPSVPPEDAGDWVICNGGRGYFCGYSIMHKGGELLIAIGRELRAERSR